MSMSDKQHALITTTSPRDVSQIIRQVELSYLPTGDLRPSARNARTHSKKQQTQLKKSVVEHGHMNPILADELLLVIAGHARLEVAKDLGLATVPVIILRGLSERQKRTLMLADNKIAANAGWDLDLLATELKDLVAIEDLDISLTGFEAPEIDRILFDREDNSSDPADECLGPSDRPVTKRGDLWLLGKHRLLCGDAREIADLDRLCGADLAAMAFLDPPYNVRVSGIVGRGATKHAEFAMASGEMTPAEFQAFLEQTLGLSARFSRDGAVHFVCMDWRHVEELMAAGRAVYGQTLNLIAWVKSNAGQGSFYRSQHELIGVFRVGDEAHLNNIELGKHGRSRSNVWEYAGVNSFGKGRLADLKSHPTVKPVAMVADAIKDCTRRGDIVLDSFAGSGTTLLACERVGRQARCLEFEPAFVDVAIRRWQAFTGKDAVKADSKLTFDDILASHASEDRAGKPVAL